MIFPELAKLIYQIELKKNRKTNTLREGESITQKAGRGLDFKEVREYIFGDDIRYIDWNVSSRMGDLYVKEYHKENDRLVYLFLDESASMFTSGTSDYTKYFIGFQFLAFASLVFLHKGDRIHILTYSNQLNFVSPTLKTKANLYQVLKRLYDKKASHSKTDHTIPFAYLKNKVMRNSLAYVISDFCEIPSLNNFQALRQLYDLNAIRIYDTIEIMETKFFDYFFISNSESTLGGKYKNLHWKDQEELENFFKNKLLNLRADEDISFPIMRYLLQ